MSLPVLPNLPTDNLYKFIAIFGLIIFLGTLIYYITERNEIRAEDAFISFGLSDTSKFFSAHRLHQEVLEGTEDLITSLITDTLNAREQYQLELQQKWLHELEINLQKEKTFHSDSIERLIIREHLLQQRIKHFTTLKKYLAIGACSGILMIITGFYFWYFRVQKITDQILLKQLNDLSNRQP